jgi:uncharacterized membrane protein
MLYDAPAIAIMALIGGFLNPILLRSDRDQYRALFGYIAALDLGALALLKHWQSTPSLSPVHTCCSGSGTATTIIRESWARFPRDVHAGLE